MGFRVGIPILDLKRGKKAAAKCKKGGDARSICVEAGEERYSRTKNYDPSRSGANVHLGPYSSGVEAYAHILDEVERAEEIHRAKDAHGRGYRKNFTVAYAVIIKPEGEWINAQTPDDRLRFFADAQRVLSDLGVMPEDETVMCELHRDEGYSADEPCDHLHIVGMAGEAPRRGQEARPGRQRLRLLVAARRQETAARSVVRMVARRASFYTDVSYI